MNRSVLGALLLATIGCASEPAKPAPAAAQPAPAPPAPEPARPAARHEPEDVSVKKSGAARPARPAKAEPDHAKIAELERRAKSSQGKGERVSEAPRAEGPGETTDKPAAKPAPKSGRPEYAAVGELAPDLVVSQWKNSGKLELDALKGKLVLLVFFQHQSAVFRNRILPRLKHLQENFSDKVTIIGVHLKGGSEGVAEWVEQAGIRFAVCVDDTDHTFAHYRLGGTPAHVLVDKNGVIKLAEGDYPSRALAAELGTKEE